MVALSGALMPGPLLTVTITECARRGFKIVVPLMFGHALLELVLVVALVTGLATLLTREAVSGIIGLVGGLFLLYLGWGMVKETYLGKISLSEAENNTQGVNRKAMSPFVMGVVVSISNPYWSLWWATVGLVYVTMALKQGMPGVATFYAGHIIADFSWYLMIAAAVAGGRKFLNDTVYRVIIGLCGLFLVGLGVYFIRYGYISLM
ncbi:MAG: LysE family transporter [Methylocystaceae bacterium]